MRKTIRLPHLGFAVFVEPKPKNWSTWASVLWTEGENFCTMVLPDDIGPAALAHEIVHVLYYICKTYGMDFTREREHMGYITQYLMQEIREAQRKVRKR